jgi:hypothetical protein
VKDEGSLVFEHLAASCDGKRIELWCGVLIEDADLFVTDMCPQRFVRFLLENHVVRHLINRPGFPDILQATSHPSFDG